MKYKIEIIIGSGILLLSGMVWQVMYAQEFVPLGRLAQEYLTRVIEETKERDDNTPARVPTNTIVVNQDAVLEKAVTESIDTITRSTSQLKVEKERVIEDVKQTVKEDIDTSIIQIRQETNKEAYELQRVVDDERTKLFQNVTEAIKAANPVETRNLEPLQEKITTSIQTIENNLKTEAPQVQISFDRSQESIVKTIAAFEKELFQKRELIETREGALIYIDSDGDGISDYDEIYIYKTNPYNPRTIGGILTDGERVFQGINPLSNSLEPKQHQDPREDRESFVSDTYKVEKVELIKEEQKLVFEGTALPNSLITVYIFSTPIIVTVQTNVSGKWQLELKEELPNGEHQIYVATVDSTGNILARSNPILFTKTADAASIGIAGGLNTTVSAQNFLRDNFILITLAILIMVVILGMMFVGNHRNIKSAVSELRRGTNS